MDSIMHSIRNLLRISRSLSHAFLISCLLLLLPFGNTEASFWDSASKTPPSFADLAEEVKNPVVNISTTQVIKGGPFDQFLGPESPFRKFFGEELFERFFGDLPQRERKTNSLGSGFIISKEGFIITNNHVVEKATTIKIKLQSGKEYDAQVVGKDPRTDLALIQVEPEGDDFPKPVRLADSESIRVGDWVMAIGNPFGLSYSVTVGIISAKGRIIGVGPYDNFLQTDAAINPGNSGGPLFNMQGEVVGINTAIVARGENIGFAIPINTAKELLPQLKTGTIRRGRLGIITQTVTPELAEAFDLKEAKGVLITEVLEDSPAEKAGLRRSDIVLRFEGKEIYDAHQFSRLVAAVSPGTQAKIEILRDGKEETLEAIIGTMEQQEVVKQREKAVRGFSVQDITYEIAKRFGFKPTESGVVISEVEPGSPADEEGLKPGDIIKEVNRREIKNLSDFKQAIEKVDKEKRLLLLIKRRESLLYIAVGPAS